MSNNKQYPMQFTGRGSEYFVIWIVNIALTLVTLGIYSAWAKVRTLRWFYGHTLLDNQAFSYLATPMQILKGRLIALAALVAYYAASYFAPMLAVALLVAFLIATPWIVVSSLRFHARQSAYRGLRFDFTGSVGEAVRIYVGLSLLTIPTLGLILPYLAYRQVKFIAEHTVYGQTAARYQGTAKPFWGVYLLALGFDAAAACRDRFRRLSGLSDAGSRTAQGNGCRGRGHQRRRRPDPLLSDASRHQCHDHGPHRQPAVQPDHAGPDRI